MAASCSHRKRRRRALPASLLLFLAPCLCLLLVVPAVEGAARQPQRRTYDTHDYYVLEMQPGLEPNVLAHALGTELVEQVGELADHWLLRVPKERLERREGADAVLDRYERLRRAAETTTHLSPRHTHIAAAALSLEHQPLRQRTKRVLDPAERQEPVADANITYSAEVARRFSIIDPLWPKQWHLANDEIRDNSINVTGVWAQGVTGKGIKVAIVDDGLDSALCTLSAQTMG